VSSELVIVTNAQGVILPQEPAQVALLSAPARGDADRSWYMPLRENGLYRFTAQLDWVYVANWSEARGAWVLKRYVDGIVSTDPAYYITPTA
jgi:CelD/BcsL family acetyltransferase involved in cellulose biosynthesis